MARVPITELIYAGTNPVRTSPGTPVFIFERGTKVPAELYSAETGGDVISQPLITDNDGVPLANGSLSWIEAGEYDFEVAGETVPYTTGGLPDSVVTESNFPFFLVAQHASAQAAINAAVAQGHGTVLFPPGKTEEDLYLNSTGKAGGGPVNGIGLKGTGRYGSTLKGSLIVGAESVDSPNDNSKEGNPQISNGFFAEDLLVEGSVELYGLQRHPSLNRLRVIVGASPRKECGIFARYCNTLQAPNLRVESGNAANDGVVLETCHDVKVFIGASSNRRGVVVREASGEDARATRVRIDGHFESNYRQAVLMQSVGSGSVGGSFIGNDRETPGTYATIDIDGGTETAHDCRGVVIEPCWASAKTSGTGTFLRINRAVGTVVQDGGRITTFEKGIVVTGTATKTRIGYPVWDTVTTPVEGHEQPWQTLFTWAGGMTTSAASGKTYLLAAGQTDVTEVNVNTASGRSLWAKRIDAAEFTRASAAAKCRIKGCVVTTNTAPGQALTLKLCPYTIATGVITPGEAVAELKIESATLVKNESVDFAFADFALPAAGHYLLAYTLGGTPAGAAVIQDAELQVHYVNA